MKARKSEREKRSQFLYDIKYLTSTGAVSVNKLFLAPKTNIPPQCNSV